MLTKPQIVHNFNQKIIHFLLAYLDIGPGPHVHVKGGRIHDVACVAHTLVRHDGEYGIDTLAHLPVRVAVQLRELQAHGVHVQKACRRRLNSYSRSHRVDRVPGFLSIVRIGSAHPLTRKRVLPPPPSWSWGGGLHIRLRERRWEGSNSDEGTDTVVL
jgi:hypothetical protein